MRWFVLVLIIGAGGFALPATAKAGRLDDAFDSLGEALEAARDSHKACRRRAVRELKDLRYDIRSVQASWKPRVLRAMVRAAKRLRDETDDCCPSSVVRPIRRATAALAEVLDRWEGRGESDQAWPARGHYHYRRRFIECWSASDAGCRHTKGGNPPMDRAAFASFLQLVRSASPHIFPMRDRVQSGIQSQYLTSLQLATLLDYFKPHVFPMLEVVKICAPRLVDPQNGAGIIAARFAPHTMVGSDAAAVVAAQRAD